VSAIIPIPRCPISIRRAVAGDYAFIDRLQDMHSKALGFMRKAALEGKIAAGEVLIAEEGGGGSEVGGETLESLLPTTHFPQPTPIGYCISSNRYLKRDELGIVYQMNVVPSAQRKLVAAKLLKTVFERAPWGCKLFCCWCAQDLDANYFWESLGFIPLAFRTGGRTRGGRRSEVGSGGLGVGGRTSDSSLPTTHDPRPTSRARVHIFWQRRIREGDTTTPYWFPSKTDGGMMREDRLVLPIPPGVHWKSEMPILIPEAQNALPEPAKNERSAGTLRPIEMKSHRVLFGSPDSEPVPVPAVKKDKPAKPKREKVKADPAHVAAARELRDRYLEHYNRSNALPASGKYEVCKQIEATRHKPEPVGLLN